MDCEVYYESGGIARKNEKIKDTYFDRLINLNIHPDVIEWIHNKIESSGRKTTKINNEHLYTFIYSGYKCLKIECDPISLAELMNINLAKSEVSKMLSGTYGKESCISDLSITIPIIVISPKIYVREVLIFYLNHYSVAVNLETLIFSVEFFIDKMCQENRFLEQENPKNMAAAACFYFMSLKNKGYKINKSFFIDKTTNERLFNRCFLQLKETFEKIDESKASSFFV